MREKNATQGAIEDTRARQLDDGCREVIRQRRRLAGQIMHRATAKDMGVFSKSDRSTKSPKALPALISSLGHYQSSWSASAIDLNATDPRGSLERLPSASGALVRAFEALARSSIISGDKIR